MSAELYYNPFCTACGAMAHASAPVRWVDATQYLEAASRLGITRLPALVVGGKVVVQGPRALTQVRDRWPAEGRIR